MNNKDRTIDNSVSSDCGRQIEVTLPNGSETIGAYKFKNSEIEKIVIPDSVRSIGSGAFQNCKNLKEVTLPNGLEIIDENAFENSGIEKIVIPDSVLKIGFNAFRGCRRLRDVEFNNGLKIIDAGAFLDCEKLEHIILPDGLQIVGACAFGRCRSLMSLTVPPSAKLGKYLLFGCSSNIRLDIKAQLSEAEMHDVLMGCKTTTMVRIRDRIDTNDEILFDEFRDSPPFFFEDEIFDGKVHYEDWATGGWNPFIFSTPEYPLYEKVTDSGELSYQGAEIWNRITGEKIYYHGEINRKLKEMGIIICQE